MLLRFPMLSAGLVSCGGGPPTWARDPCGLGLCLGCLELWSSALGISDLEEPGLALIVSNHLGVYIQISQQHSFSQ